MIRQYIIANPSAPLEPAGSEQRGLGVVRHVAYVGDMKVVTWDYTQDKHGEE